MSKKILVISTLISMTNPLFANTYKQDSVMFPGEIPETRVIEQINNALNNPEYSTLVQQLDEQLCPSGFTDSRGRIMYRNMVRDVVGPLACSQPSGASIHTWSWNGETKVGTITCKAPF